MLEHSRSVDVRVGIFVLAALAVLVVGSLWIGGMPFTAGASTEYRVRLQDSGGVQAGDRVRYAGVAVGRVQDVRLDAAGGEWPVEVVVALQDGLELTTGTTARIASSGLLGGSVLVIEAGDDTGDESEQPMLAAGGVIQGVAVPTIDETLAHVDELGERAIELLDKMSSMMDQVSADMEPLMANASALLSEENAANVEAMLASLRQVSEDVSPRVGPLLERLEALTVTLENDLEAVPELTEQASELLAQLQAAMGPDGERLAQVLDAAEGTLGSADHALEGLAGSRQEIEWTLRDLRDAAANMKAFSQMVKERPYSLIRIKNPPDRQPGDRPGGDR